MTLKEIENEIKIRKEKISILDCRRKYAGVYIVLPIMLIILSVLLFIYSIYLYVSSVDVGFVILVMLSMFLIFGTIALLIVNAVKVGSASGRMQLHRLRIDALEKEKTKLLEKKNEEKPKPKPAPKPEKKIEVEIVEDSKINDDLDSDDPIILLKFKELLNEGLITEEEYNKKKKEILENKYN